MATGTLNWLGDVEWARARVVVLTKEMFAVPSTTPCIAAAWLYALRQTVRGDYAL
jgi:hypothetical protein